ncbi:hypothetical protein Plhal304r1_c053g0137531 [Plasmopara halstedii]
MAHAREMLQAEFKLPKISIFFVAKTGVKSHSTLRLIRSYLLGYRISLSKLTTL